MKEEPVVDGSLLEACGRSNQDWFDGEELGEWRGKRCIHAWCLVCDTGPLVVGSLGGRGVGGVFDLVT